MTACAVMALGTSSHTGKSLIGAALVAQRLSKFVNPAPLIAGNRRRQVYLLEFR
jgi:cobyric acid synthase